MVIGCSQPLMPAKHVSKNQKLEFQSQRPIQCRDLDKKQIKESFEGLSTSIYNTYLVLGQDYDYKAESDMEVTVRGTMATENSREFKEMNECANSEL
jgi:hypothetical protein